MKKIIPILMCVFFPIVLFILLFSSNNVNAANLQNNYSITDDVTGLSSFGNTILTIDVSPDSDLYHVEFTYNYDINTEKSYSISVTKISSYADSITFVDRFSGMNYFQASATRNFFTTDSEFVDFLNSSIIGSYNINTPEDGFKFLSNDFESLFSQYGHSAISTKLLYSLANWDTFNVNSSKGFEQTLYLYKETIGDVDLKEPILEPAIIVTDIDSPFSLEYILSQTKFEDEVDGELECVIINDNYTANMYKVGRWQIDVSATDKSGNTGYGTILVIVEDVTSPIIEGISTYTSYMSNLMLESTIRENLIIIDNVDELSIESLNVMEDTYTNSNSIGEYKIKYQAIDLSGNVSAIFEVKINIVDDIKPIISMKEGYTNHYTTSYKVNISQDTLLEGIMITDNVDLNLEYEIIENKYLGNETVPGTYFIKLRAIDKSGNISDTFTITVNVNDKIPPVFYVNGLFIGVSNAETLSHQDIVNILYWYNNILDLETEIQIISSDYSTGSINNPGAYSLMYRIKDSNGEISEPLSVTIKVFGEENVNENTTEDILEQAPNRIINFLNFIGTWLGNIWEMIVNFFNNLFLNIGFKKENN